MSCYFKYTFICYDFNEKTDVYYIDPFNNCNILDLPCPKEAKKRDINDYCMYMLYFDWK